MLEQLLKKLEAEKKVQKRVGGKSCGPEETHILGEAGCENPRLFFFFLFLGGALFNFFMKGKKEHNKVFLFFPFYLSKIFKKMFFISF